MSNPSCKDLHRELACCSVLIGPGTCRDGQKQVLIPTSMFYLIDMEEEEKEESFDRKKEVCHDLLTQAFASHSRYNSAVHLLQSKSLLSMGNKLVAKLRLELPDERASSLLTALHIENLQDLLQLSNIMKSDQDLKSTAEEMLAELSKTKQGN